jgi:antitoxin component of MazEF toxin-antitoxin module
MKTKIVKVGNSNAVIIPAQTMHERGWQTGDELDLESLANGLVVFESKKRRSVLKIVQRLVAENRGLIRRLSDL